MVAFFPILVLGVLTISIIMLSSYLSREGVSFDIREQAVYEQICPGSVSAWPSWCVFDTEGMEGMSDDCEDIRISWDFPGCDVAVSGSRTNIPGIPGGVLARGESGWFFTDVYPPGAVFYFTVLAQEIKRLRVDARYESSGPVGDIKVSPRPCILCPGSSARETCPVRVEWSISNAKFPRVRYKYGNFSPLSWDNRKTGVRDYNLINRPPKDYVWFGVYDGNTLLDSADSYIYIEAETCLEPQLPFP